MLVRLSPSALAVLDPGPIRQDDLPVDHVDRLHLVTSRDGHSSVRRFGQLRWIYVEVVRLIADAPFTVVPLPVRVRFHFRVEHGALMAGRVVMLADPLPVRGSSTALGGVLGRDRAPLWEGSWDEVALFGLVSLTLYGFRGGLLHGGFSVGRTSLPLETQWPGLFMECCYVVTSI